MAVRRRGKPMWTGKNRHNAIFISTGWMRWFCQTVRWTPMAIRWELISWFVAVSHSPFAVVGNDNAYYVNLLNDSHVHFESVAQSLSCWAYRFDRHFWMAVQMQERMICHFYCNLIASPYSITHCGDDTYLITLLRTRSNFRKNITSESDADNLIRPDLLDVRDSRFYFDTR